MEKETNKNHLPFWVKLLLLLMVAQNVALTIFIQNMGKKMDNHFSTLEQALSQTQNLVGDSMSTVSQEVEQVLSQQNSLVSDFYYTLQPAPRGKILLTLSAQLKSYHSGSAASFSITTESGETSLIKSTISNNTLTASVTLPLCDTVSVGLLITDQQNTQSQSLAQINHMSDCLTDHLFLTPDIEVKQQGSDLFFSGNLSLINEFGSLEEQQLDMVRLEIRQGDTLLHTFYFSQDYSAPLTEGQQQHILLFERIKTSPAGGQALSFSIRARDQGNFEYFCTFAELPVSSSGLAGELSFLDADFEIVA